MINKPEVELERAMLSGRKQLLFKQATGMLKFQKSKLNKPMKMPKPKEVNPLGHEINERTTGGSYDPRTGLHPGDIKGMTQIRSLTDAVAISGMGGPSYGLASIASGGL